MPIDRLESLKSKCSTLRDEFVLGIIETQRFPPLERKPMTVRGLAEGSSDRRGRSTLWVPACGSMAKNSKPREAPCKAFRREVRICLTFQCRKICPGSLDCLLLGRRRLSRSPNWAKYCCEVPTAYPPASGN